MAGIDIEIGLAHPLALAPYVYATFESVVSGAARAWETATPNGNASGTGLALS